jgi:hypothetical protein
VCLLSQYAKGEGAWKQLRREQEANFQDFSRFLYLARARARAPASTGYSGNSGNSGRGREMDIADFGLLCGNDLVIYDRNGRVVS